MLEFPSSSPEKRDIKKDDARKFIIGAVNPAFLERHQITVRDLVVDWTEVGGNSETKIVRKTDDRGNVSIWRTTKVKVDGSRSKKEIAVDPSEYSESVTGSLYHLEKRRYEWRYEQNGTEYLLKYDVFENGLFYLLEVDADTPELRAQFDTTLFMQQEQCELTEVSGSEAYEGYHIVETLAGLPKTS